MSEVACDISMRVAAAVSPYLCNNFPVPLVLSSQTPCNKIGVVEMVSYQSAQIRCDLFRSDVSFSTLSPICGPTCKSGRSAAPRVNHNHKPVTQNALKTILAGSCKRLSRHLDNIPNHLPIGRGVGGLLIR